MRIFFGSRERKTIMKIIRGDDAPFLFDTFVIDVLTFLRLTRGLVFTR